MGHEREGERFRHWAVQCVDSLFSFALSLCRDRAVAQDLVQETYMRALRAAHRPHLEEGVRPWLFTILHNVWRNERRRRPFEPLEDGSELLLALPAHDAAPDTELDERSRSEQLRRAIEALPDGYREVVMLRFGEGLSYQEIARALGCPAGTVMSRLARARAALRRALRPELVPIRRGGHA